MEKGSFFQKEIAYSNLAIGVSAIYSSSLDTGDAYKTAVMANMVFLSGCAIVHLMDFMKRNNRSILNIQPLILEVIIVLYSLFLIV